MFDLVIRNAQLVDGTGAPARRADLATAGGRVAAIGEGLGRGREELDADGLLLLPGFVDPHTHYDGQATWDPELQPSGWHGVTTAILGNCVEDIPGSALHEGIRWAWETFPEFLDAIGSMPRALDVACQVPHAPIRGYVMGPEAAEDRPASEAQIAQMGALVAEGLRAGALGFTTSRTSLHRTAAGKLMAGTNAAVDELRGIARAMAPVGHGVIGLADEHGILPQDLPWLEELAGITGRSVIANLSQSDFAPDAWTKVAKGLEAAAARGAALYGMTAGRSIGILMNFRTTAHPFALHPSFRALPEDWEARKAALRDPAVRARILAEDNPPGTGMFETFVTRMFAKMYPFDGDYEPEPGEAIGPRAAREGRPPLEVAYDALLRDDATGFLYFPLFNYGSGDLSAVHALHASPRVVWGLSDAGAHCGAICDGGMPTWLLTHWVRDRARGPRWPLEAAVHRLTGQPAALYGLGDRGVLAPGRRADLNLVDFARLGVTPPAVAFDLPAGGRRLVQRARGYVGTWVAGVRTVADDVPTGARPGRLVRGVTGA